MGTPMILNIRQAPPPPPPPESKRLSIMPFQTLSTKRSSRVWYYQATETR